MIGTVTASEPMEPKLRSCRWKLAKCWAQVAELHVLSCCAFGVLWCERCRKLFRNVLMRIHQTSLRRTIEAAWLRPDATGKRESSGTFWSQADTATLNTISWDTGVLNSVGVARDQLRCTRHNVWITGWWSSRSAPQDRARSTQCERSLPWIFAG